MATAKDLKIIELEARIRELINEKQVTYLDIVNAERSSEKWQLVAINLSEYLKLLGKK